MQQPPCVTPPAVPAQLDFRNPTSCLSLASDILQAYYRVISGSGRITVRFQERWTEYQKSNAGDLLVAYCNIYNQCPAAQASGLPNLNPGNMVKRGRPMRGLQFFPRL